MGTTPERFKHMATNRPVTVIWEETRDLGNAKVTLRLEMPNVPVEGSGLEADLLMAKANSAFKHYIDNYAPHSSGNPPRTPDTIILPATKLSVKMDGLKRLLRVHAGQFQKHGVPLYDEVLKEMGRDTNNIPLVGFDLTGWNAHIQMNGEKPVKVVKLVKANVPTG